MNKVHAHITVQGKPLCQCEGHIGGLMNSLYVTCGYSSIAAAHRAKRELQKKRWGVKVVRGDCPV